LSSPTGFQKQDVLSAMSGHWEQFYRGFTDLEGHGTKLRGPCPIHKGHDRNFEIDTRTGHWTCYSQCQSGGDAFSFMNKYSGKDFPEALTYVAEWANMDRPAPQQRKPPTSAKKPLKIEAIYDYVDEDGGLLYQAVRYERENDRKPFKQRAPDGKGGYIWSVTHVRHVLYRLPEVLAALDRQETIWVVEGEKDANRLHTLGLCATTNVAGAKKWLDEYSATLHGANVVILPDNDTPGAEHAVLVANSLYVPAAQVRIVEIPGLGHKGDVSDFLDAGGTKDDLLNLAHNAKRFIPEETPITTPEASISARTYVPIDDRVIDLSDVPPPPSELPYLFGPYLNKGASHWITGQTGLGKSTLMYNIMSSLAEGKELWSIPCEQHTVLYVDAESGDIGRSLKIDRLYGLAPKVTGRLYFMRLPVKMPEELDELVEFVKKKNITIVVFDTARRCFAVRDENDNAEVYRSVVPCLDRLKSEGIATVTLGHPSKSVNGRARGAGAQEDAGDVNLSLTMHRGSVEDKDGIIALKVTKNRLLGMGTPPLYLKRIGSDHFKRIDDDDPVLRTEGDLKVHEPTNSERCQEAILETLNSLLWRRCQHQDLERAAKARGFPTATFGRAFRALRDSGEITKRADGQWELPVDDEPVAEWNGK